MYIHVVEKGDTLFSLARRHGILPADMVSINKLSNTHQLIIGQTLLIPEEGMKIILPPAQPLAEITKRYHISEEALVRANPFLANMKFAKSCQPILIPSYYNRRMTIVNAYAYPSGDAAALNSAIPHLTYISLFSYQVRPDGSLSKVDDHAVLNKAETFHAAPKMVITNIAEGGSYSRQLAHHILSEEALQDSLLFNIIQTMQKKAYSGLEVIFMYLYPQDRSLYHAFLRKTRDLLHPMGFSLSTAVAPKLSSCQQGTLYEAHDYHAHGCIADEVTIMAYEWGYLNGPPMAIAPLDQVKKVIEYAIKEIPPQKILLGIPNYGYDWVLPNKTAAAARDSSNTQAPPASEQFISNSQAPPASAQFICNSQAPPASAQFISNSQAPASSAQFISNSQAPAASAQFISNSQALKIAALDKAQIQFDEIAQSPYFTYKDNKEREHIVWFEDARSIKKKLELVEAFGLGGVSYWTANHPFAQNWAVLQSMYEVEKIP